MVRGGRGLDVTFCKAAPSKQLRGCCSKSRRLLGPFSFLCCASLAISPLRPFKEQLIKVGARERRKSAVVAFFRANFIHTQNYLLVASLMLELDASGLFGASALGGIGYARVLENKGVLRFTGKLFF